MLTSFVHLGHITRALYNATNYVAALNVDFKMFANLLAILARQTILTWYKDIQPLTRCLAN